MSELSLSETVVVGEIFVNEGASALNPFMSGNQSSVLYTDSVAAHAIESIQKIASKKPSTDTLGHRIMDWYVDQVNKYKDSTIVAIKAKF